MSIQYPESIAPAANILSGSTFGGTVITIPAGRKWVGTVSISAALTAGTGALTATAAVTVAGSGAPAPASGTTIAEVALTTPAEATPSSSVNGNIVEPTVEVYADANNPATLTFTVNNMTASVAMANGYLI